MPNFLFWNLNGKNNDASIVRLTKLYDLDVLIFAEYVQKPMDLLMNLEQASGTAYHFWAASRCPYVHIFSRFSSDHVMPVLETKRYTIRQIHLPGRPKILLAAAHLPSNLHVDPDSRVGMVAEFADDIHKAETTVGHRRTVLVGDLNCNPFAPEVVGAHGLHAMMSRKLAKKAKRVINRKEYTFFYNPMWSHFGEANDTPPGTYFHCRATHVNYFWNIFDQVMVRPDLMDGLPSHGVQIVTSDGDQSFLKRDGTPDEKRVSDHLPILFTLAF